MALACKYSGVDIRQEQIEANYNALDSIRTAESEIYAEENRPVWHCGDSKNIRTIIGEDDQFDFLLMCPPYGDLERYSDDPADISTMGYADFLAAYRDILLPSALNTHPYILYSISLFHICHCHLHNRIHRLHRPFHP